MSYLNVITNYKIGGGGELYVCVIYWSAYLSRREIKGPYKQTESSLTWILHNNFYTSQTYPTNISGIVLVVCVPPKGLLQDPEIYSCTNGVFDDKRFEIIITCSV